MAFDCMVPDICLFPYFYFSLPCLWGLCVGYLFCYANYFTFLVLQPSQFGRGSLFHCFDDLLHIVWLLEFCLSYSGCCVLVRSL